MFKEIENINELFKMILPYYAYDISFILKLLTNKINKFI